ncbi:MAG: divalent-cation tolerance protein CutA [Candidatus Omnitrophica bacterium]|nr:divalent-cation tolerance protein CutA [Candidatus Omnitrophota bacterium]
MYIVVFITAPGKKQAKRIAQALLKRKLAACVNIVDTVESLFWWKGKIDTAEEALLVAKTRKPKFTALVKAVRSLHSYTVPEIIAVPIVAGNKEYLEWIDASVR